MRQDSLTNMVGGQEYWSMINQEMSIAEAMKIDQGRQALQKELDKLEFPVKDDKGNIIRPAAWDLTGSRG